MTVIATLVVGADGSTSRNGNSAGVTSEIDRTKFLQRRRLANCIIIGGNTARTEPYHRTPVPVVVISRALINPLADNRLVHCWNLSATKALDKAIDMFGPRIHIEAGISIINELLRAGRIDELELSITEASGGEDKININELLSHFASKSEEVHEGTRMISAKK